ncbi:MAG: hypothetical protein C4581_06625 [Nitrospiraceae bacterium]|nr:MAG: hypothetical protein C4581_06625 [Nitrospiraceae bacterium]
MENTEYGVYQVQDEKDKSEWYKVVLSPLGMGVGYHRPECNCPEYVYGKKVCEHIERAISAHHHGL